MPLDFEIPLGDQSIETPEKLSIKAEPGSTIVFVGANGSGKTKLAALIESLAGVDGHRISAHRALELNPKVAKISEESALKGLWYGYSGENSAPGYRQSHRYGNKPEIHLLKDFDFVVQALFADQSRITLQSHKTLVANAGGVAELTKFERLQEIWKRLLPHRSLIVDGDDITVQANIESAPYSASDMSDGERSVFYLVGQALLAKPGSLLIVDEPELHIHPSIHSRLWDEIEAARPDCAFLYITHDLKFAAERIATKYVVKSFAPETFWEIEPLPDGTGFSEDLATLILGSRKPILFVEGSGASLDKAVFRACYPGWTIVPRGSCDEVVHAVTTMRANQQLTRITCAGLIDADGHDPGYVGWLNERHIFVLPVAEIENLFLLPSVVSEILKTENFGAEDTAARKADVTQIVFDRVQTGSNRADAAVRHAKRRIDRKLKGLDAGPASNPAELQAALAAALSQIDVSALAQQYDDSITAALTKPDQGDILALFDDKTMLKVSSGRLKEKKAADFLDWLIRAFNSGNHQELVDAVRNVLPEIQAA